MRQISKKMRKSCLATTALIVFSMFTGCSFVDMQNGGKDETVGEYNNVEIENITPNEPYRDDESPTENSFEVQVEIPDEYGAVTYEKAFETDNGTEVKLSAKKIKMAGLDLTLEIIVDDKGYLDWWSGGSTAQYIESAEGEYYNSSWPISVDGHDGTVLIQGTAAEGGEMSGDAFVILDGATIWFSSFSDGAAAKEDAYSTFFHSEEMNNLLNDVKIIIS